MIITILTLFPEYFTAPLTTSLLARAVENDIIQVNLINIRNFTTDSHRTVDDRPFGGGPGMVMKVEPIAKAVESARLPVDQEVVVLLSARGQAFAQKTARNFAKLDHLILICGHYSDVDQRVADHIADMELRVGEAVLTGGEPAAALILDATSRLLPGVLGNEENLLEESLDPETGIVASAPAYTRPADYQSWQVPEVLLTGNHAEIEGWKKKRMIKSQNIENKIAASY